MNTNVKRLRKELQELRKSPEEDMVLFPEEDTIMRWKAFIRGPADTPFADRAFELAIQTTPLYPMEPPKMKFVTKIFHPNVHFKVRSSLSLSTRCSCDCVWGHSRCIGRHRTAASASTFSSASGLQPGRCGCVPHCHNARASTLLSSLTRWYLSGTCRRRALPSSRCCPTRRRTRLSTVMLVGLPVAR